MKRRLAVFFGAFVAATSMGLTTTIPAYSAPAPMGKTLPGTYVTLSVYNRADGTLYTKYVWDTTPSAEASNLYMTYLVDGTPEGTWDMGSRTAPGSADMYFGTRPGSHSWQIEAYFASELYSGTKFGDTYSKTLHFHGSTK